MLQLQGSNIDWRLQNICNPDRKKTSDTQMRMWLKNMNVIIFVLCSFMLIHKCEYMTYIDRVWFMIRLYFASNQILYYLQNYISGFTAVDGIIQQ